LKIISTRLFGALQLLLKDKIQSCELSEMDHYIRLLNETNDEKQVVEISRECVERSYPIIKVNKDD